MTQVRFSWYAACAAALIAAACARSDERSTAVAAEADSVGTSTSGYPATGAYSTSASRSAARDTEQEFLREMVDHHQGLIEMAAVARTQAATDAVQKDAQRIQSQQADEQQEMLTLLHREYGDSITPAVPPASQGRMDSLRNATTTEFDHGFYRNVITHHREGIQMIDRTLPRLSRSDVKNLAEQMKSDMENEIREIEKKIQ
jgi:uncharacterized protein (DUF305 family)